MPLRLRVDDFLFTKREEYESGRHTLAHFLEFDSIIPVEYLLGVIPASLSVLEGEDASFAWDIKGRPALHGRWHDESRQDDFEGMSAFEVQRHIEEGILLMEKVGFDLPRVYMPPHNAISLRTVIACRRAGFDAITVGPGTELGLLPFISSQGLKCIESMPPYLYGRSDELIERGAVDNIRSICAESETKVTLGLHWTWEYNIGLDNLKRLIDSLSDILVDF